MVLLLVAALGWWFAWWTWDVSVVVAALGLDLIFGYCVTTSHGNGLERDIWAVKEMVEEIRRDVSRKSPSED